MTIRRIGVLTGGGDVPGLNACVKTIPLHAIDHGWDVVGFRGGYHGILHFNPADPDGSTAAHVMALSQTIVRTIDRAGGTILHTTRMSPDRLSQSDLPSFLTTMVAGPENSFDSTAHILRVLQTLRIDALVALGGDGTLNYAARLHREGVPVMLIP